MNRERLEGIRDIMRLDSASNFYADRRAPFGLAQWVRTPDSRAGDSD